jgi:hypothetical protein
VPSKIFTIFEGTSEIERMLIGGAVTGLDLRAGEKYSPDEGPVRSDAVDPLFLDMAVGSSPRPCPTPSWQPNSKRHWTAVAATSR